MPQGVLPYQYEQEDREQGATALAGLPVYLDLAHVMGLRESVERHVGLRAGSQGWTDAQIVTDLTLLQLAGGECVDDLRILEGDEGFCGVRRRVELHGMSRRERRIQERRWRKARRRTVASPSAAFRYLEGFHDEEEEGRREAGRAWIPTVTAGLLGLRRVNAEVVAFVQSRRPSRNATLDVDATLIESHKEHVYDPLRSSDKVIAAEGFDLSSESERLRVRLASSDFVSGLRVRRLSACTKHVSTVRVERRGRRSAVETMPYPRPGRL